MANKERYTYSYQKEDNGMVTLSIEIPWNIFEDERKGTLSFLGREIEVKGFRKGHAPLEILEQRVGKEASSRTLQRLGGKIIEEIIKKEEETVLSAIRTIKVAQIIIGKPVQFTVRFLGVPNVKVKGLKKVKIEEKKSIEVKDDEILKVLKEIWEEDKKATREKILEGSDQTSSLLGPNGKPILTVSNSKKGTTEVFDEKRLDDDWAKRINPSVNSLLELKNKIREAIKKQKEEVENNEWERKLLDKVAEYVGIKIPKEVLEPEVVAEEERFYQTLRSLGIAPADYVATQGVSMDDLRKRWRKNINETLVRYVTLRTLANNMKIEVSDEEVREAMKETGTDEPRARYSVLHKKVMGLLVKEVTIVSH